MPFVLSCAFGALLFSLLLSLALFARHSRKEKSDYEKWLEDVAQKNVVTSRFGG